MLNVTSQKVYNVRYKYKWTDVLHIVLPFKTVHISEYSQQLKDLVNVRWRAFWKKPVLLYFEYTKGFFQKACQSPFTLLLLMWGNDYCTKLHCTFVMNNSIQVVIYYCYLPIFLYWHENVTICISVKRTQVRGHFGGACESHVRISGAS